MVNSMRREQYQTGVDIITAVRLVYDALMLSPMTTI
jgi:hypothetical protein